MSIQTVIVERYRFSSGGSNDWEQTTHYLEESAEEVRASIDFEPESDTYEVRREVYSLDEYLQQKGATPLSDFCPAQPKKGIWWLAVDKEAICELLSSRSATGYKVWDYISDMDSHVEHHHVTLAFDVNKGDKPAYRIRFGNSLELDKHPILVKGLAYNDKCACLVVEVKYIECCNKHPHITLATAEGVPPVYSNDMLAGKYGPYHFLPLEAELEGQLEFFEFS